MLRSFDVFDTVLTRLVGLPESMFLLLGQRAAQAGHWPHSPERFMAARMTAESHARLHAHPREVTLAGIYDEIAFAHGLSAAALRSCQALEVELENVLLRPVPAARRAIDQARATGHSVAFISDIYLPLALVRDWLARPGLAAAGDAVWVSSESGMTKASGELFKLVREQVGSAPTSWFHTGDNLHSDVAMPRSLGIRTEFSEACRLTRYERQMEAHASATGALSSLLAGAARWVRLSHPAANAAQTGLRDIAAGVAGPVLWAFVTWVLRTAQREGLRRIWFTARDGQVMLRVARRIAPHLGIDIEMGYLYGGRQVVHLAALERIDERALKWLTGGAGAVSVEALLERVGLQPADVADALRRHGLPIRGPIGWARAAGLDAFFTDAAVATAVLAVARERREDIRSYFSTCGLIGGEACAVVDIGWRGSVLRSIVDLVGPADAARHRFLYFGLYARPPDVPEAAMTAFCFDLSGRPALGSGHDVPSLTSVMEIFCQADHPQIVHVERRGSEHVPRLRAPPAMGPTLWDVAYFQDAVEAFADAVLLDLAADADADLRPMVAQLLQALMATPSPSEASVLGSVQYIDDQGGTTSEPFAHPYRLRDLRAVARSGELPGKSLAWWEEGAWALTPKSVQLVLRAARKFGKARQPRAR